MNDSSKEFCKLQYQISNIVNSRYRGVDWLAVAGNICVCYLNPPPPDYPNGGQAGGNYRSFKVP